MDWNPKNSLKTEKKGQNSNASCRYKWIETLNKYVLRCISLNSNASCRYKWIETKTWWTQQWYWYNSNASCRYKWIETLLRLLFSLFSRLIPTPLVGINGLKQNLKSKPKHTVEIPTPLVGINGLKQVNLRCKLIYILNSNASCRYKWIETRWFAYDLVLPFLFQRLL